MLSKIFKVLTRIIIHYCYCYATFWLTWSKQFLRNKTYRTNKTLFFCRLKNCIFIFIFCIENVLKWMPVNLGWIIVIVLYISLDTIMGIYVDLEMSVAWSLDVPELWAISKYSCAQLSAIIMLAWIYRVRFVQFCPVQH